MAKASGVGYGRPPKRTQFKKGQSGNPKGRPKGSINLATELSQELSERITVREDGKPRKISKQRALLKTLMAKALQGDIKAVSTALALHARLVAELPADDNLPMIDDEVLILKRFAPRVLKSLEQ